MMSEMEEWGQHELEKAWTVDKQRKSCVNWQQATDVERNGLHCLKECNFCTLKGLGKEPRETGLGFSMMERGVKKLRHSD